MEYSNFFICIIVHMYTRESHYAVLSFLSILQQ